MYISKTINKRKIDDIRKYNMKMIEETLQKEININIARRTMSESNCMLENMNMVRLHFIFIMDSFCKEFKHFIERQMDVWMDGEFN